MIGGLPWTAWLLLALAVVPGVGLAVVSYRIHRNDPSRGASPGEHGDATGTDRNEPAER